MKVFRRHYVLSLYRTNKLEEILDILEPWISEVLHSDSPFLRQVASYHLRPLGSSSAPRFFKSILAGEIIRLNETEDLKAALRLSIIISYRDYNPSKGNVSLVTWLAWRIPYELSKLVTWRVVHPITPFEESFLPSEIEEFERTFEVKRQIGILSKDLDLDKQSKHYYLKKVKD